MPDIAPLLILASCFLAILLAPMGCMVVWRGVSFVGEALSHGALLGVAIGTLFDLPPGLGIWVISLAMVMGIQPLSKHLKLDTLLACWMYVSLGLALWFFSGGPAEDLLWGDILLITWRDMAWLALGSLIVISLLARFWPMWLWYGLQTDMALVENPKSIWFDRLFWVLVATVTALTCQSVGTLLVPALLVLPASAVRPFSKTPQGMMWAATGVALTSFWAVLPGVFYGNWPVGPSVVVLLGIVCVVFHVVAHFRNRSRFAYAAKPIAP